MNNRYLTAILFSGTILSTFLFTQTAFSATLNCTDLKTTLRQGMNNKSNGSEIIFLQDFLRARGHLSSLSTGFFGEATFKAVKSFQTTQKIQAVGSVGPLTRAEIKKISCVKPTSPISTAKPQIQATTTAIVTSPQVAQVIATQKKVLPPALPYRADSFRDWQRAWGSVENTSYGSLLIKGTETESSAQAIYLTSSDWTDYKYTANVSVSNGNIMLVSRRIDDNNLLICNFSGNIILIQQRINGETTTLASTVVKDMSSSPYFQKSLSVSMRVKGDTVGCTALGGEDNVTFTGIDNKLMKGGIAIQTWFEVFGSANLELHNVSVEAI